MIKQIATLAVTVVMAGVVTGASYADNDLAQVSLGELSPNVAALSNNDFLSDNVTDVANDKSILSHNDASVNDSFNTVIPIANSFNDSSTTDIDSHDDFSDSQLAFGQVNLNDSSAGAINAADNCSTIFDGDVIGLGGGAGGNVNTGILSNSILGSGNAQFSNVGIGLSNAGVTGSTLNNAQTTNLNVLGL